MPTINQLIRKPRVVQHAKKKVPALQPQPVQTPDANRGEQFNP